MNYHKRLDYLKSHHEFTYENNMVIEYRYGDEYHQGLDTFNYDDLPTGVKDRDITKRALVVNEKLIEFNENKIDTLIYYPDVELKNLPCILYAHGGGFISGDKWKMHQVCKALCEKAESIVINIDYRLAPAYGFPAGFEDCRNVLSWLHQQNELNIDKNKICFVGDSAGASLLGACALYQAKHHEVTIAFQALIYPCVLIKENKNYPWSIRDYEITNNKLEIVQSIMEIRALVKSLDVLYLQKPNLWKDPYASIYMAESYQGMPKTLIVTAEYDYLRKQDESFYKRMVDDGVEVRMICYGGMTHAFLDHIGYYPQSEDVIDEIAYEIQQLI